MDYTANLEEYPLKLKKYFLRSPHKLLNNYESFFKYISDDYKDILKKVSLRYSNNIEDVYHFLIPWFFPADFILEGVDEGHLFRNKVRSKKIVPEYGFPKTSLFKDIQDPFLEELISIGVKLKLETKVEINNSGICFFKKDDPNNYVTLTKKQTVFFCGSPVSILKFCSRNLLNLLTKNRRILINAIIEIREMSDAFDFSEILCADINFYQLSRISKINKQKSHKNTRFQLEIYSEPNYDINLIKNKIENFFKSTFLKFNYQYIGILGIGETRSLYFPDKETLLSADNEVKKWSKSFPFFFLQKEFGPINMAKTWIYSNDNEDAVK